MSLKREDAMTHAPDLLLLSQYDPEMGEVAAFEELIGSHGGLGGSADASRSSSTRTSGSSTSRCRWAPRPIYRNLRRWLSSMGIELGKPAPTPVATAEAIAVAAVAEAT